MVNGTRVGGETPGGAGNEVLESETPAGIRAWVCGRTTPGGLGMEICGWACADLILGVRDPWGAGLGGGSCPGGCPRGSREPVLASREGRESWGGLESAIRVGGGGALDGKGHWVG